MLFQKLVLTACVAVAATISTPAFAQSNADGFIAGIVADASDGSVIVATSKATGAQRQTRISKDGSYRISGLPVGEYEVALKRPGVPDQVRESVTVSVGGSTVTFTAMEDDAIALAELNINASAVSPINFGQTEVVSIFRNDTIERLPIARDVASVALLAPGTVRGEAAFETESLQKLASFGGASVAENAYFINGFNVTNFRNGLGGSTVPFEMYQEFQVKTGGYGAEFGRSTGGVINAITKRGGNQFHGGVNVFYQPEKLTANAPDVYLDDGSPYRINNRDERNAFNSNVYLSGPILKDRIFFYGIYQLHDSDQEDIAVNATQFVRSKSDDPFWGGKLDFQLTNEHLLEFTAFTDKRDTVDETFEYNFANKIRGASLGETHNKRGGKNYIARYSGQITEAFSISALYGRGKYDLTTASDGDAFPAIYDEALNPLGSWTSLQKSTASDEREAIRIDGTLKIRNHTVRFGYDREDNLSRDLTEYSGGIYWRYYNRPANGQIGGFDIPEGINSIVRERVYNVGGKFEVGQEALYLEDTFTALDDRLTLSLGLRNESFENKNKLGETFVKIDDQLAHRIGFAYAMPGERSSKIFGNIGRYYLPVASNTNVRMAGGELFTETYFAVDSKNSDGTPNKGAQIGNPLIYSDGNIPDYRTLTNLDIKPMYQEEYILGYQMALSPKWTIAVRGVYRNLATAMDDIIINDALQSYADRNGITEYEDDGIEHYVLTNPGKDIRMFWDMTGDGTLDEINLTNDDDLHFPVPKRKYYALELSVERVFSDKWMFQGSYTWSQSYGNTEGYVRSDLGQSDAGITASFDTPALQVNSWGRLPNDRRHAFKGFGLYQINQKLQTGVNVLLQSGRPINRLGNNPDGSSGYAGDFYTVPQGSVGTTPWIFSMDWSLQYSPMEGLRFGVDVFNILNADKNTQVYEFAVDAAGNAHPRYMKPTVFQAPRTVRFSASYSF